MSDGCPGAPLARRGGRQLRAGVAEPGRGGARLRGRTCAAPDRATRVPPTRPGDGLGVGVAVGVLDVLKGFLPAWYFGRYGDPAGRSPGSAAVLGHVTSPLLKGQRRQGRGDVARVRSSRSQPLWAMPVLARSASPLKVTHRMGIGSVVGTAALVPTSFVDLARAGRGSMFAVGCPLIVRRTGIGATSAPSWRGSVGRALPEAPAPPEPRHGLSHGCRGPRPRRVSARPIPSRVVHRSPRRWFPIPPSPLASRPCAAPRRTSSSPAETHRLRWRAGWDRREGVWPREARRGTRGRFAGDGTGEPPLGERARGSRCAG